MDQQSHESREQEMGVPTPGAHETHGEAAGPASDDGGNGVPRFLSKEEILRADDEVVEIVAVPEWGGHLRVKAMTGTERDAFESDLVVNKGKKNQYTETKNIRAKLAARTIVGEDGKPLFTPADVAKLGQKSAAALDRVFTVAMRLSKITEEDLEELKGNSEPDRSDDS